MNDQLKILTFGGLRILRDETAVSGLASRKAEALLVYLACNPRPHGRETLATLFWPDAPPQRSLANLSVLLSSLRKQLAPFLEISRHTIGVAPQANIYVDAVAFDKALAHDEGELTRKGATRIENGVKAYKAPFLDGFFVRRAAPFTDWVLLEQTRLQQRLMQGLMSVAQFYGNRQQGQQALFFARQLVEQDTLREESHRLLMRLLAESGQKSEALSQFEACAAILKSELAVAPDEETVHLRQQIERGEIASPANGKSVKQFLGNLPPEISSFVGRAAELQLIAERMSDPNCRLLTIVGQGGVGKTRLLLAAARQQQGQFLDGVWVVSLASLERVTLLETAVAEAVGFSFAGNAEPRRQLRNYLSQKEMLLLFDNAEHLLGDHFTSLLTDILRHAPEVQLLVSSRERLHLRTEWLLVVEGLSVVSEEAQLHSEATTLFLQRARQVEATFAATPQKLVSVSEIVTLLAGMPLGIELAATALRYYDVATIAREIEADIRFLQTNLRDLPARHRSLQAVIQRSWALLSEAEQQAFAGLSVFRGNFLPQAAEAVLGQPSVVLFALVDKSLVERRENGRFQLHNLLRQFAAQQLSNNPQTETAVRARHAAFYLELLARWREPLKNGRQQEALVAIMADIENIRGGWQFAQTSPHHDANGLTLISNALDALFHFFSMRSWFREGVMLFNQAVVWLSPPKSTAEQILQARLRARYGWFAFLLGEREVGEAALQESATILQQHETDEDYIFCHNYLGAMAFYQRRFDEAEQQLEKAIRAAKRVRDFYGMGIGLNILGVLHLELQQLGQAEAYLRESLRLKRQIGDLWGIAFSLEKLGGVHLAFAHHAEAKRHLEESLAIRQALGDRRGEAHCLRQLGDLAMQQDDAAVADALYVKCLAIFRQIGDVQAIDLVQERLVNG